MIDTPALLRRLGIDPDGVNPGCYDGTFTTATGKPPLEPRAPRDGTPIARVARSTREDYERCVATGLAT